MLVNHPLAKSLKRFQHRHAPQSKTTGYPQKSRLASTVFRAVFRRPCVCMHMDPENFEIACTALHRQLAQELEFLRFLLPTPLLAVASKSVRFSCTASDARSSKIESEGTQRDMNTSTGSAIPAKLLVGRLLPTRSGHQRKTIVHTFSAKIRSRCEAIRSLSAHRDQSTNISAPLMESPREEFAYAHSFRTPRPSPNNPNGNPKTQTSYLQLCNHAHPGKQKVSSPIQVQVLHPRV
mmetsp:Transcript_4262/g.6954  ORF Transcript_4262/g.6954 Transcript_4262/m.6954 type:complete len:236 (+) Transcript_4262:832-1539(+)